jgi:hypothetical protein
MNFEDLENLSRINSEYNNVDTDNFDQVSKGFNMFLESMN